MGLGFNRNLAIKECKNELRRISQEKEKEMLLENPVV